MKAVALRVFLKPGMRTDFADPSSKQLLHCLPFALGGERGLKVGDQWQD